MATPTDGSADARSLHEVAVDVVMDLGKLSAGLHAAGANPQAVGQLMHMAQQIGDVAKVLGASPGVGGAPADTRPEAAVGGQPPQAPQAAAGAQTPQAPQAPQGMPAHGLAVASPPPSQQAPGTGPAHGPMHEATQHLQVAMQAAKAAAASHAALAAQAAQNAPASGGGAK